MLRKYWFYTISLLHVLFDLGSFLSVVPWLQSLYRYLRNPLEIFLLTSFYFLWCLSILNGMFLITYGFLHTNTIMGTFIFQQLFSLSIIASAIGVSVWNRDYGSSLDGILFAISAGLHAGKFIILWGLLLFARISGDRDLGRWTVNVEDLASGTRPVSQKVGWRGMGRHVGRNSRRARSLMWLKPIVLNVFIRRVRHVETKRYAFCQHLFSLTGIALLLIRIITIMTQLQNEQLPSRTLVQSCAISSGLNSTGLTALEGLSILVRHSELRDLASDVAPESINLAYKVTIGFQRNEPTGLYNATAEPCSRIRSAHSNTRSQPHPEVDWFDVYFCNGTEARTNRNGFGFSFPGFIQYSVTQNQDARSHAGIYDTGMPSFWLTTGSMFSDTLDTETPYLVPPLRPIPKMHTIFETHYAQRKFISSSPLRDAITGSKPTYDTTYLYPWSQLYSLPISSTDGANTTLHSSGFIRWPTYLDSAPQIPQSDLAGGTRGPKDLCEVTEDYRISSAFDVLASIGGLLALLQALHVFMFGRPLFWGIFGSKIITPFGFFGRFATKGFRQRLREHYHVSDPENPSTSEDVDRRYDNMRLNQFLLDYVLDLGPASLPKRETEGVASQPSRGRNGAEGMEIPPIPARDSTTK